MKSNENTIRNHTRPRISLKREDSEKLNSKSVFCVNYCSCFLKRVKDVSVGASQL
jgi:hypothetical protein